MCPTCVFTEKHIIMLLYNLTLTKREYNSAFFFSGLCFLVLFCSLIMLTWRTEHIDLAEENNMFAIHGNAFKDDILITPLSSCFIMSFIFVILPD